MAGPCRFDGEGEYVAREQRYQKQDTGVLSPVSLWQRRTVAGVSGT